MAHAHGADAVSELRYRVERHQRAARGAHVEHRQGCRVALEPRFELEDHPVLVRRDRKSTRLNSSHSQISYAVFCLKKKKIITHNTSSQKPSENRRATC